jgi:hypothetical protein
MEVSVIYATNCATCHGNRMENPPWDDVEALWAYFFDWRKVTLLDSERFRSSPRTG